MYHRSLLKSAVLCITLLVASAVAREVPKKTAIGDAPSQHGLDPAHLPQNIAVYSGATIQLTCWVSAASINSPRVQWMEYAYSVNGQLISDGNFILPAHPQSARYELNRTEALQYNLIIKDVRVADAGVYLCTDTTAAGGETLRASAQLIVIDSPMNCTSHIPSNGDVLEGLYYSVECVLDYRGHIIPFAHWEGPQLFGQAQSSTPTRVWTGLSFYANRTMSRQNWINTFNFTNNFHPIPADAAGNIPDFVETYETNRITVYWTPKDLFVDHQKEEYEVGDQIECSADAFPTANIIWHNLRTNVRYEGSILTIPEEWLGTYQELRCQAINVINDREYSNDIIIDCDVPEPTTTPPTTTPTTTTPPPAVSSCLDLTGRWEAAGPTPAHMCIEVLSETGNIHGVLRNDTDTYWVDLIGLSDANTFDHTSYTGIWPQNRAVSTFIGECSRCHGEEHLLINGISRTKGGPPCATPGEINYSLQYDFKRNPNIFCPPITFPPGTFDDDEE